MANYATLKAAINAVIKANGNKEITGTVLNETLTAMVNSLGANYQFAGVATPSTNPGTPDQNMFYLAGQAGTYTNFNSIVLPNGVSVLKWNGSWSGETVLAGDGVFDISAYKATGGTLATFADLSAALDGGNNIPSSLRKGGMSVKFVQSSDNKYVQYRLMSDTFNTTVTNWQGVDDKPTAGSDNLIKSGGCFDNGTNYVLKKPGINLLPLDEIVNGFYIDSTGAVTQLANPSDRYKTNYCPTFIEVVEEETYNISNRNGNPVGEWYLYFAFYDSNKSLISTTQSNSVTFTTPSGCKYVRVSMLTIYLDSETQLTKGSDRKPYTPYISYDISDQIGRIKLYTWGFLEALDNYEASLLKIKEFNNSGIISRLQLVNIPIGKKYNVLFCGRLGNGRCLFRINRSGGYSSGYIDYYPNVGAEENDFEVNDLYSNGKFVVSVDWSKFGNDENIFEGINSLSNRHRISAMCYIVDKTAEQITQEYNKKVPILQNTAYRNMLSGMCKAVLSSDDDTIVGIMGDSIWAGVGPTDFTTEQMKTLPPNMENPSPSYWLYMLGIKNKPIWRRFNADNVFTENGTFTTEKAKFNTANSYAVSDGKPETSTRQCETDGASVSFSWNLGDYEKMAFVHRLRYDGAEKVVITISGGNGNVLVKHNQLANPIEGYTDGDWVEANGYVFTQLVGSCGSHNHTSSFANFTTYFKAVSGITSSQTITFTKDDDNTDRYLYYWGYGMWNGKTIILENCARGGISLAGIVGHIQDDLLWRHPDLIMLECPLANTVNGGRTAQWISENLEAMIFNTGPLKDTINETGASYTDNNLKTFADAGKIVYFVSNYFRGFVKSDENAFVRYCPTETGTPQDRNGEMMYNTARNLLSSKDKDYIDYANIVLDMADEKGILWFDIMKPNTTSPLDSVLMDNIHPNEFGAFVQGYLVSKIINNV